MNLKFSNDTMIRSADIKLGDMSIISRPINNLYPLEISNSANNMNVSTNVNCINFALFKTPMLIISLLLLVSHVNTHDIINKFDNFRKYQCPSNLTDYYMIYSEVCVKNGYVVYKNSQDSTFCFKYLQCTNRFFLFEGTCSNKCFCPSWASDCSFKSIIGFDGSNYSASILEFAEPNVCSYEISPYCSKLRQTTNIPQIILFNNETHFVKDLNLIFEIPSITSHCFLRVWK